VQHGWITPFIKVSMSQIFTTSQSWSKIIPYASLSTDLSHFNSLLKVLFMFPSRYLFAIDLPKCATSEDVYLRICVSLQRNTTPQKYSVSGSLYWRWVFHSLWDSIPRDRPTRFHWRHFVGLQLWQTSARFSKWVDPNSFAISYGNLVNFSYTADLYA